MTEVRRPRAFTSRNVAVTAGVVLAALVAWLVVRAVDSPSAPEAAPVLVGTCEVLAHAERAETEIAKVVFVDRVHEPIHELAGQAADGGHRREAARLLEAKNVIESSSPGPTAVAAQHLVAATRDALRALGEPAGACSEP